MTLPPFDQRLMDIIPFLFAFLFCSTLLQIICDITPPPPIQTKSMVITLDWIFYHHWHWF